VKGLDWTDAALTLGLIFVVAGVAMVHLPAAFIVAGVLLLGVGYLGMRT
jgi:hypothetical protein